MCKEHPICNLQAIAYIQQVKTISLGLAVPSSQKDPKSGLSAIIQATLPKVWWIRSCVGRVGPSTNFGPIFMILLNLEFLAAGELRSMPFDEKRIVAGFHQQDEINAIPSGRIPWIYTVSMMAKHRLLFRENIQKSARRFWFKVIHASFPVFLLLHH